MRSQRSGLVFICLLALTGCHPKKFGGDRGGVFASHALHVGDRLSCPDRVEDLTRTAGSADGQACAYGGPDHEEVQLSLAPLNGQSADLRLAALDRTLRADLPAAVGASTGEGVPRGGTEKGKQAHIDLPGFHLDATDGTARIRMPGVSINADDDDANVTSSVDGVKQSTVHAHGGGAEIRTGEVNANGVDVSYLLASDTPGPGGDRVVGYVAKGPAAGPLVVGVFHARAHAHHDVAGRSAVRRLVGMNVGG